MRYDEVRANSLCDDDHMLGALLNYFLMPENTGVSRRTSLVGWWWRMWTLWKSILLKARRY